MDRVQAHGPRPFVDGRSGPEEKRMTAEPVDPGRMAAEPADALTDRGLVLVSAAYLEELEDAAHSVAIETRADEGTVPFRFEDYV